MILLILFFSLSLVFSFLCSVWEAVLLSITPSYVTRKLQEGSAIGTSLNSFKEDIDRPLSAILTLNTIAHTVGAIGVGAYAGKVLGEGSFLGLSYETHVAIIMTLSILIFSEIIPKTLGANKWQSLAPFTVKSLKFLLFILAPLVWVSQLITKSLKKEKGKSVFSRADLSAMAAVGEQSGAIEKSESTIISNLLTLNKLSVHDIMTPRTVIISSEENTTVRAFYDANDPMRFSRIPIHKGNAADDLTGLVLKDEILKQLAEDNDTVTLKEIARPLTTVKSSLGLQELFDKMIGGKVHLMAVLDDYGSLVGIVSMEDLIETILGMEITDESDSIEDLQKLARKKWKQRAKINGLVE